MSPLERKILDQIQNFPKIDRKASWRVIGVDFSGIFAKHHIDVGLLPNSK